MDPPRPPIGRSRGRSIRKSSDSSSMSESSATTGRVPGASGMLPVVQQQSSQQRPMTQPPSTMMSSASSVSSMEVYSQGAERKAPKRAASTDTSSVCTRPQNLASKQGTTGQIINLCSNYFRLCKVTDCVLYQYHVDFQPEEDRPHVRKALLKKKQTELRNYIFDGMILFTTNRYPQDWKLQVSNEDETKSVITITQTRQVNRGDHEYLQFFNMLMRKCLQFLKLQQVGRNFFDPHAKINMGNFNMELWPGYLTSIREHEHDILMCTRITHKVMRTDNVLELLMTTQRKGGDWQKAFMDLVIGLIVLTDYNNRTYRIDDVDFKVTPNHTFVLRGAGDISYADYYKKRYNMNIRILDQPMLISKSKSKEVRAGLPETVYLVPELCRLTGLTDEMRGNYRLMSALAEHTRVGPSKRVQKLLEFSSRMRNEKQIVEELDTWSMKIEPTLAQYQGRVLPQENIVQGSPNNEIRYPAGNNVDWTPKLKRNPMLQAEPLSCWVVMVPRNIERDTCKFLDTLLREAKNMGFNLSFPLRYDIADDNQATYVTELENMLSQCDPQPSLVLCAVSNNRGDRYSAIKKKCCIDRPIPTQVITSKAMSNKNLASIASKVAIQINCKVGGAPWTVEMPMKGSMIVGFDVSHDTMNKSLSYGCLVASLNSTLSRYFSIATAHKTGEEMSNEFGINIVKAVRKYQNANNGVLPARIIIFRDGVGDGQIPYVCKHEVAMVKEKLTEIYGGETWRMGFLIVSKRINTRIFTSEGGNPPAGTVVDDCITLPERYDFFVVSQSVNQGTVSPTSYNVISDNTGLDPDKMQRLAYKLTHVYYNWSGAVRVPGPVQYAHKLAALCSMYLHRPPSPELDDLLYFL